MKHCSAYGASKFAVEVSAEEMLSPYAGNQPGDPDKLGQVLVKLVDMETPPRLFVAPDTR